MKQLVGTTLLWAVISAVPGTTHADFHITRSDGRADSRDYSIACPSNFYNCSCLANGERGARVVTDRADFIQVAAGLCGATKTVDLYLTQEGHWEMFFGNHDGQSIGKCFPNQAESTCRGGLGGGADMYDRLVCYSFLCS